MDNIEYFHIKGTKTLIFRREGDDFYVFDPIALEGCKLNYSAACILYLISENNCYNSIIDIMSDWFEQDKKEMEQIVLEYLQGFPLLSIIAVNLIELGVPING